MFTYVCQGQASLDFLTLKIKAVRALEMSVTVHQPNCPNIQGGLNHYCSEQIRGFEESSPAARITASWWHSYSFVSSLCIHGLFDPIFPEGISTAQWYLCMLLNYSRLANGKTHIYEPTAFYNQRVNSPHCQDCFDLNSWRIWGPRDFVKNYSRSNLQALLLCC
jgi:hypothetical protein